MINEIFAAPKGKAAEKGFQFALDNKLGFEIPHFIEPDCLENTATEASQWEKRLENMTTPISMHGPVYDLNPASLDRSIAEASSIRYQQALAIANQLNCVYMVVHTQYNTLFTVANCEPAWHSACIDFWQQFAEEHLNNDTNVTILLENFMESEPEQLRNLVDGINHPQVKACFDTGHANIFSQASLSNWLEVLGHQMVYVHAHNNHGHRDEHRGFLQGTLDMDSFLNQLIFMPNHINLALEIFDFEEMKESYAMVERYKVTQQQQLPEKTFLI